MSCRFAAIALVALCGCIGAHAQESAPPRDLEPQYIDLLGSWLRPDSGRSSEGRARNRRVEFRFQARGSE